MLIKKFEISKILINKEFQKTKKAVGPLPATQSRPPKRCPLSVTHRRCVPSGSPPGGPQWIGWPKGWSLFGGPSKVALAPEVARFGAP